MERFYLTDRLPEVIFNSELRSWD